MRTEPQRPIAIPVDEQMRRLQRELYEAQDAIHDRDGRLDNYATRIRALEAIIRGKTDRLNDAIKDNHALVEYIDLLEALIVSLGGSVPPQTAQPIVLVPWMPIADVVDHYRAGLPPTGEIEVRLNIVIEWLMEHTDWTPAIDSERWKAHHARRMQDKEQE